VLRATVFTLLLAFALPALSATTVSWDGGGDGETWSDPLNWSADAIPGAADNVVINVAGAENTILHTGSDTTIASLTCEEPLTISGGSLTLTSGASSINGTLTLNSGRSLVVNGAAASLTVPGAATIDGAHLQALAGGTLSIPMATSLTGGRLTLDGSGSSISLPALTSLDKTRFFLSAGATFTAPAGVTAYDHSGGIGVNEKRTIIAVTGAGSALDLSGISTFTASFSGLGGLLMLIHAADGGAVDLSGLTSLAGGGSGVNGGGPLELRTTSGGLVNLDALRTATGNGAGIKLNWDTTTVSLPALSSADRIHATLPPAAALSAPVLTRLENGSITLPDTASATFSQLNELLNTTVSLAGTAALNAPGMTSIDHSRIHLTAGASYALPSGITNYDSSGGVGTNEKRTLFSADGPGSSLNLSPLQSITANFSGLGGILMLVAASNDAAIDLSGLTAVAGGGSGANGGGPLEFRSTSGGQIKLPNLQDATGSGAGVLINLEESSLSFAQLTSASALHFQVTPGGTLSIDALTTLQSGSLTLPDGASVNAGAMTRFLNCNLSLDGTAALSAASLVSIDQSRFILTAGATYALPSGVTSYDSSGNMRTNEKRTLFSADGEGAKLDLSPLQSITAAFNGLGSLQQIITASDLGEIDLSGIVSIAGGGSGVNGGGPLILRSQSGGVIKATSLTTLAGSGAGIHLDIGGTLDLGAASTALQSTLLDVASGAQVLGGAIQNTSGSTIQGSGVIRASVLNEGSMIPGGSPGKLDITGDYTQTSTGTLTMEIGGAAPGSGHDQLTIQGAAILAGQLNVSFLNAFEPAATDFFALLSYASLSGTFSSVTGAVTPGNLTLDAAYGTQAFVLVNEGAHAFFQPAGTVGTFTFQILTIPGFSYEIQYADSLPAASWNLLTQLSGTGAPQSVSDPSPPNGQRFYRAVITGAPAD